MRMPRTCKLSLFIIFCISLFEANVSFAQLNQPPNPGTILNQIPGPVSSFVNSAKQISDDITYKSASAKFSKISPRAFFNEIDTWFYNITGARLVDIIKPIGNLLAWIFSALASLIKWGLSFL